MPAHLIAEEGPHRGLILNLSEGEEWIIGRDPDACDLYLEDATVSRKHARLTKTADGIYLKNLSRVNPSLVNEVEHGEAILLKEGDRIQIGNTVFLFSEEEIPEETPQKKGGYDDIFGDLEGMIEEPELPKKETREAKESAIQPEELRIPPAPPKPEATAYDTIFEDTGNEEDLPFNLISPEAPLLLKVIAGPNAGAEIGIERGRVYTIGKDPNSCDIVFQDLSVSRNHARLSVDLNGTLEIEDLGSKNGTAINGTVTAEKKIITPQDLVALGTTVFMIIDREAPEETIYSPIPAAYEPPKTIEEDSSIDSKAAKESPDWKKEPIPMKYWIMVGSGAAIFLIVFLSFFSLFKAKGLEIAHKEPASEIKEALAKFSGIQFSFNPGSGKLFLVGHVLTPVDYQEMKYRLSLIDFILSTEDNVVIDEGVWKTMNDVMSENEHWRGISIHGSSPGKFVVNGYIPTTDEATRLSDYLTLNFPYLDRLDNRVVIEDTLNTQLQSLIAGQQLGGVTFQLSNGNVILSGRYNEAMTHKYHELIKELNGIHGVTSVKDFAIATHASHAGIDLTQNYQVTGSALFDGEGYSVVMNGRIYTLGDQVDGMKITTIESNAILLERDGLKYRIDYTR